MLRNIRSVGGAKHWDAINSVVVTIHNCPARFLGTYRDTDMYVVLRGDQSANVWLWRYESSTQQDWSSVRSLQTMGMGAFNKLGRDVDSVEDIAGGVLTRCPGVFATVEEFHEYFSEYPTAQEVYASQH